MKKTNEEADNERKRERGRCADTDDNEDDILI